MNKYKLLQHHINQILFNRNENKLVNHVDAILKIDKKYCYQALNDNILLKYIENHSKDKAKKTIIIAALLSCLLQWYRGTQKEIVQLLSSKQNTQLPYGFLPANCWDAVYLAIFYLELKLKKYSFASIIYNQRLVELMDISKLEANSPMYFLSSSFSSEYSEVYDESKIDHYSVGSIIILNKRGDFCHVGFYLGSGMIFHHWLDNGFKIDSIKHLLWHNALDQDVRILSLDNMELMLMHKCLKDFLKEGIGEGKVQKPRLTMMQQKSCISNLSKVSSLEK
ncbi:NlpC/P60 family protein [Cysteiniphilum sp. JM-1]|uniref:NlpC/P60 family protein n=1 Tax=Cysteiniphilum sp. JM-1 TaxID=2610891 RepID=UPI0012464F5C|nr:NlpC/P60 family protein [Cysteiniphilum sp. JM-1]